MIIPQRRDCRAPSLGPCCAMAFDTDSHAALAALIDYAKQAGADASEASLAARESISAEVRMGELEGMEREEGRSVALRAFIGKRQAAASSTDLSAKGLQGAGRSAWWRWREPRRRTSIAACSTHATTPRAPRADLEQSDTARPNPEQLLELAKRCEAASLAIPGIANSGGGGASSDTSYLRLRDLQRLRRRRGGHLLQPGHPADRRTRRRHGARL